MMYSSMRVLSKEEQYIHLRVKYITYLMEFIKIKLVSVLKETNLMKYF